MKIAPDKVKSNDVLRQEDESSRRRRRPSALPDRPTETVLSLQKVHFSYGNQLVLDDINFNLQRGQFLGLIGPNGSGKTTLLKVMLGILRPQKGRVVWFGRRDQEGPPGPEVAYVPQMIHAFPPEFPATAAEVVASGLPKTSGLFRSMAPRDWQQVHRALAAVGMEGQKDQRVSRMSGGQRQRVFIARALVSRPQVILLDEPTAGVDPQAQSRFYELLARLHRQQQLTLVLVSHDTALISRQVTHLACLNRHLFYHGDVEGFLGSEEMSGVQGDWRLVAHHHCEDC